MIFSASARVSRGGYQVTCSSILNIFRKTAHFGGDNRFSKGRADHQRSALGSINIRQDQQCRQPKQVGHLAIGNILMNKNKLRISPDQTPDFPAIPVTSGSGNNKSNPRHFARYFRRRLYQVFDALVGIKPAKKRTVAGCSGISLPAHRV